jgi:hypothetical protein
MVVPFDVPFTPLIAYLGISALARAKSANATSEFENCIFGEKARLYYS